MLPKELPKHDEHVLSVDHWIQIVHVISVQISRSLLQWHSSKKIVSRFDDSGVFLLQGPQLLNDEIADVAEKSPAYIADWSSSYRLLMSFYSTSESPRQSVCRKRLQQIHRLSVCDDVLVGETGNHVCQDILHVVDVFLEGFLVNFLKAF